MNQLISSKVTKLICRTGRQWYVIQGEVHFVIVELRRRLSVALSVALYVA